MSYRRVLENSRSGERGIALVITILALALLSVIAIGVIQTSIASLRAAGNDRTSKAALAIAEAGAEFSREQLRINLRSGDTLSGKLAYAANGGALPDASKFNSFSGSTGAVNGTTNVPLVSSTSFGSGAFQVFLTNDRNEPGAASQSASVQSQTDTNNRIMITSFGSARGGALAAVQEQLKMFDAFLTARNMPGVLVLPGPTVNFNTFSSNARQVSGIDDTGTACFPTVAVTSNAAKTVVDDAIQAKRPNAYQSCPPFTGSATENFLKPADNPYDSVSPNTPILPGNPELTRVKYLQSLVAAVMAAADFHSLSDPGFTGGSLTDPKIIAINGDASFPNNWTGAGIILVTGQLKFNGGFEYNGLMLAIGEGYYEHKGNGPGWMKGTTLVANTNTPWASNPEYVGVPYYNDDGGGNSYMEYSSFSLARYAAAVMPLQVATFQQLR